MKLKTAPKQAEKGVILVFSLIILSLLLGIGFGVNAILTREIKSQRETANSVIAYYAAETGIEKLLKNKANPAATCIDGSVGSEDNPCVLDNDSKYFISITVAGSDCNAQNYCVKSIGIYKETRRGIEINY